MRTSMVMVALAGLLAAGGPAWAADAGPATTPQPAAAADSAQTDWVAMRQQMQDNMRAMQEQMAKIRATRDPAERRALLAQHMAAMRQQLGMMRGAMRSRGAGGCCRTGMQGGMGGVAMQGNMGDCGQMMMGGGGMMQMMMEQLQQHADAVDGMPQSK